MALFISPEKISEVQKSLNIIDIVSDYVTLKQAGKNFLGLCPFHHEKTPSFTVNVEKQIYKCFGCGEGGTVFNFLMKQEGFSFPEAVKMLAEKANIRIDSSDAKEKSQGTGILYEINERAVRFYSDMLLKTRDGSRSKEYVRSRLINDDSIRRFRLGHAPNRWDAIVNKSREWGVGLQVLEKAGLVLRKRDKACYDRFRNRLMFPIIDSQNRPVGFGARALDDSLPKYLNSPETPVFNKSKTLYGVNLAKESMAKNRRVLIMEGYTDVIMAHQSGIEWSIAVLGTALTREHVRFLRRYCDKAILVFDADTAGQKSSERNLDIFIEEDFDVNVVLLPQGFDPFDFIVQRGKQRFLDQVDLAYDFFSFKIKLSETKWDMSSISGRASAIDDILSTAMKIPDILKRDLTIKRVAEELSVEEDLLRSHMTKFKASRKGQGDRKEFHVQNTGKVKKAKSGSYTVEMAILGIMINRNDLIGKIKSDIGVDSFKNSGIRSIVERVFELYSRNGRVELSDIFPMLSSSEMSSDIVDTISKHESMKEGLMADHSDVGEKMLNECIQFFEKAKRKSSLKHAKVKMLGLGNTKENEQEVDQLLAGFHKKSMDFHSLKKSC